MRCAMLFHPVHSKKVINRFGLIYSDGGVSGLTSEGSCLANHDGTHCLVKRQITADLSARDTTDTGSNAYCSNWESEYWH